MKPFSPAEAAKESVDLKISNIPDFVIESVNELLAEKYNNGKAQFDKDEIIAKIQSKQEIERQEIYNKNYLDFEDCFRKQGWVVEYHKGAYYETWTPYFTFEVAK